MVMCTVMDDPITARIELREPEQLPLGEVAICVPAYKAYKHIGEFLKGLYNLDYPKNLIHLRFAISGKDPTLEMIQSYVTSFGSLYASSKVKFLKQFRGGKKPQYRNLVLARNVLQDMSKGLDILFLDSDMFIPPHSLIALRNDTGLGATIVGGINPFLFDDVFEGKYRTRIALPAFTVYNNKSTVFTLHGDGKSGWIGNELLGKRVWVDSVGGGIFYVKSHLWEKMKFEVSPNEEVGDDVYFCFKARQLGFKILSDFNVYCGHWGFNLFRIAQDKDRTYFMMKLSPEMLAIRRDKRIEKSY